jgi:HAE1 family hydrophobic/amphiphilic exporter-1
MKLSLPGLSTRHPVTVLMLLSCVFGAGIIAADRMPLKFLPEMDFPFINCFIPYPGATPQQVEREIAIAAEGEFRTIPGLRRITSYSNSDGCRLGLRFEDNINMSTASAEVRDRMERLKLNLPEGVDRMFLSRQNINSIPIMVFGLFREGDEAEFIHLVRTVAEPRLSRLEGVAEVQILGSVPEPEVLIEFDQNRLSQNNLPLYEVVSALQTANLNISAGEMVEADLKYFVRVAGELRRPEEMANLVISPTGLRLKDVAAVGYRTRPMETHYDIDGKGGAFILLMKESEANTVETCHNVREELKRIQEDENFKGTASRVFFDQADLIEYALNGLIEAGLGGAVMAIIVLYTFLLRFRPTVVVTLAIPTSIFAALAVMYFSGMNLNIITMVSLIVAVGMLVDDAIVVIENIYRHHQQGESMAVASDRGAAEVGIAVTASTLTILVVFVPVFYMQTGEMAVHMRQFALPMCAALVASLLVSFTLIPLATSHMSENTWMDRVRVRYSERAALRTSLLGRIFSAHPVTWLIHLYVWCLDWTVRNRLASLLGVAALIAATVVFPFSQVGMQATPTLDLREVDIDITSEQNFDIAMTAKTFELIKSQVDTMREELGIKNVFTIYSAAGGGMDIFLKKDEDYPEGETPPYKTKDVLDIIKQRIPKEVPGQDIRVSMPQAGDGEGGGGGGALTVSVRISGDNSVRLAEIAEEFRKRMNALDNLDDARIDLEQTRDEMQISVDDVLASNAGISPLLIARTVDVALRGNQLPSLKQGGREFKVWAQFREEDRKNRANLDNVALFGTGGNSAFLNQLVEYNKANSPAAIQRVDGRNVMNVSARVKTDVLSDVMKELRASISTYELPPGYTIDFGEEFDELRHNMANFLTTILFAIILVYIVMSALFESLILPLSILMSVPIAFVGVYWGLFIMNTPLDTIGLIGCILMVGVVVRNGIVIIDHINLLRLEGMERHAAVVQAGRDRFRPVVMTAKAFQFSKSKIFSKSYLKAGFKFAFGIIIGIG